MPPYRSLQNAALLFGCLAVLPLSHYTALSFSPHCLCCCCCTAATVLLHCRFAVLPHCRCCCVEVFHTYRRVKTVVPAAA
jgi:hypothetical protein